MPDTVSGEARRDPLAVEHAAQVRGEAGILRAQEVRVDGVTVVRNRQPAIADPASGGVTDSECRAAVGQILAALRAHGLIG